DLRKIQSRQLYARGDHRLVRRKLRPLASVQRKSLVAVAEYVAAAEVKPLAEAMVDLDQEIVAVDEVRNAIDIIGLGSGIVLHREETEELSAQGVLRPAGSRRTP